MVDAGVNAAARTGRDPKCPVGEALVATIVADIVTPPHHEQRRRLTATA